MITGKVTDLKSGEPIPFVSITMDTISYDYVPKTAKYKAVTDLDGKYNLRIAGNELKGKSHFLTAFLIEYNTENIRLKDIKSKMIVNVKLKRNSVKLDHNIPLEIMPPLSSPDTSTTSSGYTLPSLMQYSYLFKALGSSYNSSILSDCKRRQRYNTVTAKSLNIGVYYADMMYCLQHNQPQDFIVYLETVNYLFEDLGIHFISPGSFQRIKNNIGTQDSLLTILIEQESELHSVLAQRPEKPYWLWMNIGANIEAMHIFINSSASQPHEFTSPKYGIEKEILFMLERFLKKWPSIDNDELARRINAITSTVPGEILIENIPKFNEQLEILRKLIIG